MALALCLAASPSLPPSIAPPRLARRALLGALLSTAAPRALPTPPALALAPPSGLFADCPPAGSCVSSQDDRPQAWDNPWDTDGEDPAAAISRLRRLIEGPLGGTVVAADERYVRAEFVSRGLGGTAVDDAEFYYAPDDTLLQFRAARRGGLEDFGANRRRLERARVALGYGKVPVLRNRRRALVVVESPWDSFGPATYATDELGFSAREMVPAEANRREMYGDLDPKSSPWVAPSKEMKLLKAAEVGEALRGAWLRESDDRVRSK
ncbi:hypothetical protein AB1Y20_023723 [Prymnesium parvum]|uniref:Uncharacterized protein n=1 Tax=Prymnesium parvum TaxID=97485 RepID=A0AB34JH25_PRYPA